MASLWLVSRDWTWGRHTEASDENPREAHAAPRDTREEVHGPRARPAGGRVQTLAASAVRRIQCNRPACSARGARVRSPGERGSASSGDRAPPGSRLSEHGHTAAGATPPVKVLLLLCVHPVRRVKEENEFSADERRARLRWRHEDTGRGPWSGGHAHPTLHVAQRRCQLPRRRRHWRASGRAG